MQDERTPQDVQNPSDVVPKKVFDVAVEALRDAVSIMEFMDVQIHQSRGTGPYVEDEEITDIRILLRSVAPDA